jgi:outer membrane protein assembly factor BamB
MYPFPTSSPAVVNGVVYIGSHDGNVYALDAASGNKIWNYPTSGMVLSSPAVANGVVYVGGGNVVYALGIYALNASPTQSNTLPVIIGVVAVVVIVAAVVVLIFTVRLKTK